MKTVITWQTPSGDTIDITPAQEARLRKAGVWPRNHHGEEYSSVSHGLHDGEPDLNETEIAEMTCE